jgi:DMSO/TMAO reductase YedYZ heme-binding membrane subunit
MKKLFLFLFILLFIGSISAAACMTAAQVQAERTMCLYIYNGAVYHYGSYGRNHQGHACGSDVTNNMRSSHAANPSHYLTPSYYADICTGCTPTSYTPALNTFCGSKSVTDNCGTTSTKTGTLICTSPQTCINNACSCTPTTCAAQGKNCGSISNGCGGTLNCGTCTSPQTCGGGGTANVCGSSCTPSTEICDNLDNDCDLNTDEGCDDDNDNYCDSTMTRSGTPTTCTSVGGDCNDANAAIKPGATEICDNVDNNCNGNIDESIFKSSSCGQGACLRTVNQTCSRGTWSPSCVAGPVSLEICDNIDNDCDNSTDEGFDKGISCSIGLGECLSNGIKVCSVNGSITVCNAIVKNPVNETCGDGLDNNCNGQADDGCSCISNQTQACGSNIGECKKGVQSCQQNGSWGNCVGETKPGIEICDNKDNNCDGSTDEGFDKGISCSMGLGECLSSGIKACALNGSITVCNATIKNSQVEICDNKDNDCDNLTDEGFDKGANCSIGLGECLSSGIKVCALNGSITVCNATIKNPINETCDNKDNNCDGSTDENLTTCLTSANCISLWNCTNWSNCSAGIKTRACNDTNNCTIKTNISIIMNCTVNITPNTSWNNNSAGSNSGKKNTTSNTGNKTKNVTNENLDSEDKDNSSKNSFLDALPPTTMWVIGRITGMLAFLFLALSIFIGVYKKKNHKLISYTAFVLVIVHLISLMNDRDVWGKILTIANSLTLHFNTPTEVHLSLGTISLYLMLIGILGCLFFKPLIKNIGFKNWKWIHRLSLPAYILVYIHALKTGTDFVKIWYQIPFILGFILIFWKYITKIFGIGAINTGGNKEATEEPTEDNLNQSQANIAQTTQENYIPTPEHPMQRHQIKQHPQQRHIPTQRPIPRKKIIPVKRPENKQQDQMEDVLKKLKDMDKKE